MIYMRNSDRTKVNWGSTLNCGSYALDVDTWFHPYSNWDEDDEREPWDVWTYDEREDDVKYYYEQGCSETEIYEYIMEKDADEILRQCPWLRQCDPETCDDGRRLIAYRIGIDWEAYEQDDYFDTDFHFRLRENGVWKEKNGSGAVHRVYDAENFDEPWEASAMTYDSPIIYFCFREDDEN